MRVSPIILLASLGLFRIDNVNAAEIAPFSPAITLSQSVTSNNPSSTLYTHVPNKLCILERNQDNWFLRTQNNYGYKKFGSFRAAYKSGCEFTLVLDYDAQISDKFLSQWRRLIALAPDDWEILNLYSTNRQALSHFDQLEDLFVFWSPYYSGSTAYLVNRTGMKKLVDKYQEGKWSIYEDIIDFDENIAASSRTYQVTQSLILKGGAESSVQSKKYFLHDSLDGKQINIVMNKTQLCALLFFSALLILCFKAYSNQLPSRTQQRRTTKGMNPHSAFSYPTKQPLSIKIIIPLIASVVILLFLVLNLSIGALIISDLTTVAFEEIESKSANNIIESQITISGEKTYRISEHKKSHSLLVVTKINTEIDLENLKKEFSYMKLNHNGSIKWFINKPQSTLELPEGMDIIEDISSEIFDYVLYKDPRLTLLGSPWRTFLRQCADVTICGALVADKEHFTSRARSAHDDKFDIFKLHEWTGGSNGQGPYAKVQNVPIDFVPEQFALINGSFFKWYMGNSTNDMEWCGAAHDWSNREPCVIVPLGIQQIRGDAERNNPVQTSEKWFEYSRHYRELIRKDYFLEKNLTDKWTSLSYKNPFNKYCTDTKRGTISIVVAFTLEPGSVHEEIMFSRTLNSWINTEEIDEIIMIDWGSTPPIVSWPQFAEYSTVSKIRVVQLDKPRFILSQAYNKAFCESSGEIIIKVDTDFFLERNFVQSNEIKKLRSGSYMSGKWWMAQEENDQFIDGLVVAHRSDIMSVYGYDERITDYGWEGSDLYIRMNLQQDPSCCSGYCTKMYPKNILQVTQPSKITRASTGLTMMELQAVDAGVRCEHIRLNITGANHIPHIHSKIAEFDSLYVHKLQRERPNAWRFGTRWSKWHSIRLLPLTSSEKQIFDQLTDCSRPQYATHFDCQSEVPQGIGSCFHVLSQRIADVIEKKGTMHYSGKTIWSEAPLFGDFFDFPWCDPKGKPDSILDEEGKGTYWDYRSPSVFDNFEDKTKYRQTFTRLMFRYLSPSILEKISSWNRILFHTGTPDLTVHIRWGDKTTIPSNETLAMGVNSIMESSSENNIKPYIEAVTTLVTHIPKPRVFVMTVSKHALTEFRRHAPSSWQIIADPAIDIFENNDDTSYGIANTLQQNGGTLAFDTIEALLIGAQSKYFVLNTESNISRLLNELITLFDDTVMVDLCRKNIPKEEYEHWHW